MAERTAGRRTFGPVVLVGLLAGIGLAVAGAEPWARLDEEAAQRPGVLVAYGVTGDLGVVSAANALGLVTLACWGVLLVSRGRFRRATSVLGLLAAAACVVTVVVSYATLPDDLREPFREMSVDPPGVDRTGWFWVGAVASVVGLIAWMAAVRWVRSWPEMGARYDTPSDSPPEDLWKAMDQGHDPTS